MRLKLKTWVLVAGTVMLGGFGIAVAQPDPSAPPSNPAAKAEDAKLSPQEMLARAQKFPDGMQGAKEAVSRQLVQARKQHDVVKALCLDDKLKQIEVAANAARDRLVALREAVQRDRPDEEGAQHEYTVLVVLRDRVQTLLTEANQCVGEETEYTGQTTVTVEIDPDLPNEDPSNIPDDPLITDPPVLSSPTF